MGSPIQKIPGGLLGFFGAKTQGRNPDFFADEVVGTLDTWPFYRWTDRRQASTIKAAAAGSVLGAVGDSITVPDGQVWFIENVSVHSVVLGAGQSTRLRPALFNLAAGQGAFMAAPTSSSATVGEQVLAGWQPLGGGILVGPSFTVGALVEQIAAGPFNLDLRVAYVPMTI